MAKLTIEYCSNYEPFNGTPIPQGYVLAPFVIPSEMLESNTSIIRENIRYWEYYGVYYWVGFAPVPMNDFDLTVSIYNKNRDELHKRNRKRCFLGLDEDGLPIICNHRNTCKDCPERFKNHKRYKNSREYFEFASLEAVSKDSEGNDIPLDVSDTSSLPTDEAAMLEILLAQLIAHLKKISPRYAKIVQLGWDGYSKDEIVKELNLKTSRGYQEISTARKLSEEFLSQ